MSDGSLFYVDIEDSAGTRLGPGPITSATSWAVVRRLSKAGSFSFAMPANDAMATYVTAKRVASIYAMVNNRFQYVGGGIIDRITRTPDMTGRVTLNVAGDDMLRELTYRSVGALKVSTGGMGGPLTHAQAVTAVAALAPSGWAVTADATPPMDGMYGQFAGETVLTALLEVGKQCRTFAVLTARRSLAFVSNWAASGVRAMAAGGTTPATETCSITSLVIEQQATDLITRIIPVGSGQSAVSLTLRASDRIADAGYTLDTANNYLEHTAAAAAYGRIERVVNFKDVVPISNTTADLISAANQLYENAYYYLSQRIAPLTNYRLTVAACDVLLMPGTTIRVAYRDTLYGIALDQDLDILEVVWSGDAAGLRTAQLVVSDGAMWVESDTGAVVDLVRANSIYQAHPQMNANSYVISYDKGLSYDAPQSFRWRFDEDVLQLARVVFDVRVSALLYPMQVALTSAVAFWYPSSSGTTGATAVSGTSGTTGVSGTSDATGVSGTTDNTTIGAITSANNAAPTAKATAANSAPTAKATAAYDYGITVTSGSTNSIAYVGTDAPTPTLLAGSTGASTVTGVTDTTIISTNTDAVATHQHTITILSGTPGTAVYYSGSALYTSGGGSISMSGAGNHSHGMSLSGHGHSFTSTANHSHAASSISAHTHTVNIGHTHSVAQVLHAHAITVGSHTHNYTETAHTHNYTETQHTHSTTVPAHNHTYNAGTHTHTYNAGTHSHTYNAGTHTHTYAGIDHAHDMTTVVRYGVFTADTTANMLAITEIEYSLDGATWYAWTAGVNGYVAYSDWHRVDLTALLIDANLRPLAANNALQVRLKAATPWYKIAQLEAQLSIRNIIQALALT